MKKAEKSVEQRTAAVIEDIKAKLTLIEDYMMWLIQADQRFKLGQRVEWSRRARQLGFPHRKCAEKGGIVKGLDSFSVDVLLDGYRRPHSFHHAFFNPISGARLF
jgi:hypothetical protein